MNVKFCLILIFLTEWIVLGYTVDGEHFFYKNNNYTLCNIQSKLN